MMHLAKPPGKINHKRCNFLFTSEVKSIDLIHLPNTNAMKYGFIYLLLVSFVFSSCRHLFHNSVKGDGNITTEKRTVSTFSQLDIGSAIEVSLVQGDSTSVRVEIDSNLQPYIEVYLKGSELHVEQKNNSSISPTHRAKVYVTVPSLERIEVSGACKLTSEGTITSAGKLDIAISGASEADMNINAAGLSLNMDGASVANLKGDVKDLDVDASGSCDLKAFGLTAANVDIKLEGASSVQVYPTAKLIANANGASKVFYKGNVAPAYTLNGASSISKVD